MLPTESGHRIFCSVQKFKSHNHDLWAVKTQIDLAKWTETLFVTKFLICNISSWMFPETLLSRTKVFNVSGDHRIIGSDVFRIPRLFHDCEHNIWKVNPLLFAHSLTN